MMDWLRDSHAFHCGALGMSDEMFWSRIPYELRIRRDAWSQKIERENARDRCLAWMTESLARRKRLPSMKSFVLPRSKKLDTQELRRIRQEHRLMAQEMGFE